MFGAPAPRRKYTAAEIRELQTQLRRHRAIFRVQLALARRPVVDAETLAHCIRKFQAFQLDEVAEERKLLARCGYPLCDNAPNPRVKGKRFVDAVKGRFLDAELVSRFCSLTCYDRLELLKVQVPMSGQGESIEVPLMDPVDRSGHLKVKRQTIGPSSKDRESEALATLEGQAATTNKAEGSGTGDFSSNGHVDGRSSDATDTDEPQESAEGVQLLGIEGPVREKPQGPVSGQFPVPGSKTSTFAMEGYKIDSTDDGKPEREKLARRVKEAKSSKQIKSGTPPKENTFPHETDHYAGELKGGKSQAQMESETIAAQLTAQLRELGIEDTVDAAAVLQSTSWKSDALCSPEAAKAPAPPDASEAPSTDEAIEQEQYQQEEEEEANDYLHPGVANRFGEEYAQEDGLEEEKGDDTNDEKFGLGEDDELDVRDSLGFLDLSQVKEDLASFQMSTFMTLVDAVQSLSGDEIGLGDVAAVADSADAAFASRFQVLTGNLSRAVAPIVSAVEHPGFHRALALDILQSAGKSLRLTRAVPSLSAVEWQILAAGILNHMLLSDDRSFLPDTSVAGPLCSKLAGFATSRKSKALSNEEFQSLLKTIARALSGSKGTALAGSVAE
mmetsp:Transcript_5751/g.10769  ORF Transcript_5751/g.10769 Transcript_5751/m.10769 type:complete len:615 (-) Transcript_5751:1920-3764(-)